jgi:pimeloyl-ACP methyl ester carboxylesterase
VDLRGFGKSSKPLKGFKLSAAGYARDLDRFMDTLGLEKAHVVGAKLDGTITLQFAHDYPERCSSLTVVGGPVKMGQGMARTADWPGMIRDKRVGYWTRTTMKSRLGDVSEEMTEWWISLFSGNSRRVISEIVAYAETVDLAPLLPNIKVPTLMLTGDSGQLAAVEAVKKWKSLMPNCRLEVIKSNSYHIAAAEPDACVAALLSFLSSLSAAGNRR